MSRLIQPVINKLSGTRFSYLDEIFHPDYGKVVSRWTLLLPGQGCVWAREHGGCSMCGFSAKINQVNRGKPVTHKQLMRIYRLGQFMVTGNSPKILTIYNGGSFLNNEEIPLQTQLKICKSIRIHPTVEKLVVESRPEFVTEDKVQTLVEVLGGKTLEVGIGLEVVSDEIRTQYIHKGFLRKDYEMAVNVLERQGAKLLTYVFLKPIHMAEKAAIDEAVNTITYAFQIGSYEVALESGFIQQGTVMELLYNRGDYRPPWLWSIIEVVKKTHHFGPVTIGGFEDEPPPIDIPHNCPECSPRIMSLFEEYKKTHDVRLFDGLECRCKTDWLRTIAEKPT